MPNPQFLNPPLPSAAHNSLSQSHWTEPLLFLFSPFSRCCTITNPTLIFLFRSIPRSIQTLTMVSVSDENEMERQLLEAAASGDLRLLKQLAGNLDKGNGIAETIKRIKTPKGRCALHRAAARGKTEICQYLIEELGFPVDFPSKNGATPLLYAANEGWFVTASYLIEQGADPT